MSNPNAWKKFDAYIDGELSAEEANALEIEATQSEEFNAAFQSYLSVVKKVQELPSESPPDDFYNMVRHRIRRRMRQRHIIAPQTYSWSLEAAIVVVLLGLMSALYMFAEVHPKLVTSTTATNTVPRVHLQAFDRKLLSDIGEVTVIGTSVAGDELEVELVASAQSETLIREALANSPRLHLIETSLFRQGNRITVKVRVPAGPFALKE